MRINRLLLYNRLLLCINLVEMVKVQMLAVNGTQHAVEVESPERVGDECSFDRQQARHHCQILQVAKLRCRAAALTGLPPTSARLIYQGRALVDDAEALVLAEGGVPELVLA